MFQVAYLLPSDSHLQDLDALEPVSDITCVEEIPHTENPVDSRHIVVPQSPQKYDVMVFSASVGLLYSFGVPDFNSSASQLTNMLQLYMLPLTLRQSVQ